MVDVYTLTKLGRGEREELCEIANNFIEEFTKAEDKVEYIISRVLDYRVLETSMGDVEEVHLLLASGGPALWLVIGEGYAIVLSIGLEFYEYCRIDNVHDEIFDEITEILAHRG